MALSERKTKIEQIYKDIWTYWSESKANDLRSMVATDFICHVPDYDFKGIEEYCQLMTWYKGHFTNPEYTLNDLIEGENKVVARHTVYTSYVGGGGMTSHHLIKESKRQVLIYFILMMMI
jgi:hypothetical protein